MLARYHEIVVALDSRRSTLKKPQLLADEFGLAKEFSVSRGTIRKALHILEQRGVVTRQRRVGTFLQPPTIESDGLRGKRIGIVPPWWAENLNSWYHLAILDGVSRWADRHDCSFSILHAPPQPLHEKEWLDRIRRLDLAGVLWVQPQEAQLNLLYKTDKLFPTVVLGRSIPDHGLHCVMPDYRHAAELIDAHLVQNGHLKYALVGKNIFDPYFRTWIDCFKEAHLKRSASFSRSHYFDYACFDQGHLGDLLIDFYLPHHAEFQALVFLSFGNLHFLQEHPRFCERMKSNLSVVTTNYGPYPIESMFPGMNLTHIACDWSQIAGHALDTLALLAEGQPVPAESYEEVTLIKGDTVHPIQVAVAAA